MTKPITIFYDTIVSSSFQTDLLLYTTYFPTSYRWPGGKGCERPARSVQRLWSVLRATEMTPWKSLGRTSTGIISRKILCVGHAELRLVKSLGNGIRKDKKVLGDIGDYSAKSTIQIGLAVSIDWSCLNTLMFTRAWSPSSIRVSHYRADSR